MTKITKHLPERGIPVKSLIIKGKKWMTCSKCGRWRKDVGKDAKSIICGFCAAGLKLERGAKLWLRLRDYFGKLKEGMKKRRKKF